MPGQKSNVDILITVADGLKDLLDDFVFVGGSVVYLYFENEAMDYMRPTDDVDCVVNLSSLNSYAGLSKLEKRLEKMGFKHSMEDGAPSCRKIFKGIKVDIMSPDSKAWGFTNRWYKDGIKNTKKVMLTESLFIKIFTLSYFIASKLEAYFSRGENDFRCSNDIEDIITVLDGQKDFRLLYDAPVDVKKYLIDTFRKFKDDPYFIESVSCHIRGGETNSARALRVRNFITEYSR